MISLPSSAQRNWMREMTTFCVRWRKRSSAANFSCIDRYFFSEETFLQCTVLWKSIFFEPISSPPSWRSLLHIRGALRKLVKQNFIFPRRKKLSYNINKWGLNCDPSSPALLKALIFFWKLFAIIVEIKSKQVLKHRSIISKKKVS